MVCPIRRIASPISFRRSSCSCQRPRQKPNARLSGIVIANTIDTTMPIYPCVICRGISSRHVFVRVSAARIYVGGRISRENNVLYNLRQQQL